MALNTANQVTSMTESLASGATGARTWTYTYDPGSGQLGTAVDPAGKTTQYCYSGSPSTLLTKIITARGSATGATCSTTQGTDVTDITYDPTGGVTSIKYENGTGAASTVQFTATTALTYSATSRGLMQETDPYGKVTKYYYDTSDRIRKVITPLNETATADFNTNNDATASVTPNNYTGGTDPTTTRTYTGENLSKVSTPTGTAVSVGYNSAAPSQPGQVSDDRDQSASNLTDASATTYSYNPQGQATAVSKGTATVTIRHQGDSGVANCGPAGAAAYPGAVCETRDADYNASVSTAQHRTLYGYDNLGELTSLTPAQPGNGRTVPPATTSTFDSHSRLLSTQDARGQTTTFAYDSLDRITRVTNNDGTYTAYTWDEDGNPLSVLDYTAAGVKSAAAATCGPMTTSTGSAPTPPTAMSASPRPGTPTPGW